MKHIWIRILVSFSAIALAMMRVLFPQVPIDSITFGLLAVAVLPWVTLFDDSAKLSGGFEVTFSDVDAAGRKVTSGNYMTQSAAQDPSFAKISGNDPNLALVGLRIEIECRLRDLAAVNELSRQDSVARMLNGLLDKGVLDSSSVEGLGELIETGNRAAHGARVEPEAARWVLVHGPVVLAELTAKSIISAKTATVK